MNGVSVVSGNTPVTLQVVAADDGLTVQLVGITSNGGGTVAAASSQVALDPQAAANNTALERMIAAAGARPRGVATQQALAARLVVVRGPHLNLPSGTRLVFTLAAPVTTADGGGTPAPTRRLGVTR